MIATLGRAVDPPVMMQDPGNRRLRRLDIGLLIIFQEVMALGQLKEVAEKLGLTQSAVSHALRRLSNVLGFQLFVRCRGVVTPTARAIEIVPAVAVIIATAVGIIVQDGYAQGANDVRTS